MARLIEEIDRKARELKHKIEMLKAGAEGESSPEAAERAAENLCELLSKMLNRQSEIAAGNGKNAPAAREFLQRVREDLIANYCVLWERNSAYRNEMTKLFTKEELDELMRQSLAVNPEKKRIRFT